MLFQHTLDQVLNGSKTQTRRIIHANHQAVRERHNKTIAVTVNGRDKWRVGNTYAVQPARGKPQVARIRLISISNQNVHDISEEDAIAEGFSSRSEFLQIWLKIHGADALHINVWVLKFELASIGIAS